MAGGRGAKELTARSPRRRRPTLCIPDDDDDERATGHQPQGRRRNARPVDARTRMPCPPRRRSARRRHPSSPSARHVKQHDAAPVWLGVPPAGGKPTTNLRAWRCLACLPPRGARPATNAYRFPSRHMEFVRYVHDKLDGNLPRRSRPQTHMASTSELHRPQFICANAAPRKNVRSNGALPQQLHLLPRQTPEHQICTRYPAHIYQATITDSHVSQGFSCSQARRAGV